VPLLQDVHQLYRFHRLKDDVNVIEILEAGYDLQGKPWEKMGKHGKTWENVGKTPVEQLEADEADEAGMLGYPF